VNINCRLESYNKEYEALLLDLSCGGALISATAHLYEKEFPVLGSKVSITLVDENILKTPLTLKGTVIRISIGESPFWKLGKFGIEFEGPPLALTRLISVLSKLKSKV